MNTWGSGRATEHIQDILAGTKTIEGRLNKGKFAKYQPGDAVNLREDVYDSSGEVVKHIPNRLKVEVQKVEVFDSFEELFKSIDYRKLLPRAASRQDALATYEHFYSKTEQAQHGVLAIYIQVIP